MKKLLLICVILFVIIIVGAGVALYQIVNFGNTPASESYDTVLVEIPKGAAFSTISNILTDSGVIASQWQFNLLASYKKFDKSARAGEYALSPSMTPNQIMDKIRRGEVHLHKITFPEGYTMRQMAERLEQLHMGRANVFMQWTHDPELLQKYDIPASIMEGYLYPSTYFFAKGVPEKAIIEVMLRQMQSRITDEMRARAKHLGMSIHQVLTLASIVEKETGKADERPIIASVFLNRLKRGMRLESDPTAVYGIDLHGGPVTGAHVRADNPYNTYKIMGLPPTPIASPGVDSITAVLYPATTNYLFFVATGSDGSHAFSAIYDQHVKAVNAYRRYKNSAH